MSHAEAAFVALRIAVLTVSDTRSIEQDTSGAYLAQALTEAGHILADRRIVTDDIYRLRAQVSAWIIDDDIDVILTTGGTGFSGRDSTPEALSVLFDKQVDGFGELFRQISLQEIGNSTLQSRALAGMVRGKFIFCLPGSTGACRTAWTGILQEQFDARTRPCNFVAVIGSFRQQRS